MYNPCDGGIVAAGLAHDGRAGTVLLIGLVGGGAVLLIWHGSQPPAGSASDAERILAERYARGEIEDQDYQQLLGVLRSRPGASR